MSAIKDFNLDLESQLKILRGVLIHYANPELYSAELTEEGYGHYPILADGGKAAHTVLARFNYDLLELARSFIYVGDLNQEELAVLKNTLTSLRKP